MDITEQKKIIIEKIKDMSHDTRIEIMKILLINNKKQLIKEHGDGSRINLEMLPKNIINQIYNVVKRNIS